MTSIRNVDANLLAYIQDLKARIERLEKGDKGVRVNDTRLGNSVLSPNTYTNQVEMKNLKSGEMVPLTSMREIVWSWSGTMRSVVGDGYGNGDPSPPEVVPDTMVANEIVISRPPVNVNGNADISVIFPGFRIRTGIGSGYSIHTRPIHIQVQRNDLIYVTLDCVEFDPTNVSVAVRFGQPTGQEDNNTVEVFCSVPL